ncbi:MAG: thioredoxin family protein [Bacteroidia bacterium]
MKTRKLSGLIVLAIALVSYAFIPAIVAGDEITVGAKVPKADLKMADVSGKEYSLADLKTDKGILVIFSCNTCPYVKLSETRIKEYTDLCKKSGIGAVIVNSNEGQRDGDDSFEEMKKYAEAQKIAVPYVVDKKSELADAFGATRTPQCFLFDKDGLLIYKGAIDDNVKDVKAVKTPYLKDAIVALTKGMKPATTETKSIGCTIKRTE